MAKRRTVGARSDIASRFETMNADELARATSKYDREMIVDSFGPPPRAARAAWNRAKRKRGRPRRGQGVRVISLSIERGLLKRTDSAAERAGVSRAELIARCLETILARAR